MPAAEGRQISVAGGGAIGVFDSGFGGLTVHHALIRALPDKDFVYLGDHRNAPYGTRPPLDVLNLTCAGLERLFQEGCTLVVVACNTASVVTLRWIQQQWLPIHIKNDGVRRNALSVVVPTIEAATGMGWNDAVLGTLKNAAHGAVNAPHRIAVFATRRTVESGVYPYELNKRRPEIEVEQIACPELAGAIERGAAQDELRALVARYAAQLQQKPDSVILGCTHYPLIADLFAEVLPEIPLIHQPEATAAALARYVAQHPEYNIASSGKRVFLSTGYSPAALPLIERFWGGPLEFKQA